MLCCNLDVRIFIFACYFIFFYHNFYFLLVSVTHKLVTLFVFNIFLWCHQHRFNLTDYSLPMQMSPLSFRVNNLLCFDVNCLLFISTTVTKSFGGHFPISIIYIISYPLCTSIFQLHVHTSFKWIILLMQWK